MNYFYRAFIRSPISAGTPIQVLWHQSERGITATLNSTTVALIEPYRMYAKTKREYHAAQLAARCDRNVPHACPDLDQEYPS